MAAPLQFVMASRNVFFVDVVCLVGGEVIVSSSGAVELDDDVDGVIVLVGLRVIEAVLVADSVAVLE